MGTLKKPRYLKDIGGVFSYRRRVPIAHQKTLGFKMWNRPCGKVSGAEAASLVLAWTKQDDELIQLLSDPDFKGLVRRDTEAHFMIPKAQAIIEAQTSEAMPEHFDPVEAAQAGITVADKMVDPEDRLIRYRSIMAVSFGEHVVQPNDLDDRDLFNMVKRKLERRIADLAGDPNTISAVADRYYKHNQLRPVTLRKYRGNIRKLINHVGDIPVSHVTAAALRRFRDKEMETLQPSALAAVFTPIRGLFTYALGEERWS